MLFRDGRDAPAHWLAGDIAQTRSPWRATAWYPSVPQGQRQRSLSSSNCECTKQSEMELPCHRAASNGTHRGQAARRPRLSGMLRPPEAECRNVPGGDEAGPAWAREAAPHAPVSHAHPLGLRPTRESSGSPTLATPSSRTPPFASAPPPPPRAASAAPQPPRRCVQEAVRPGAAGPPGARRRCGAAHGKYVLPEEGREPVARPAPERRASGMPERSFFLTVSSSSPRFRR
jgi:hypothetical protein